MVLQKHVGVIAWIGTWMVMTTPCPAVEPSLMQQETLIQDTIRIDDTLAAQGIQIGLSMTNIYQQNVHGGLSTNHKTGRWNGSYDLEIGIDLEALWDSIHADVYMSIEGGWPATPGINDNAVGSAWGINADAIGNRSMDVKECYLHYYAPNERLEWTIGKFDFTGIFDATAFADDEVTQFLNTAFVDNPTIPFPQYGLGIVIIAHLTETWSLTAGIADAQADGRETGFRTAFHNEDYFFYALESRWDLELASQDSTLPGTYRIGLWNDPQPKGHDDTSVTLRDDVGVYISGDLVLLKETGALEDLQGLGVFGRYGYADGKRNNLNQFWSIGLQYQGLIPGRDLDTLGTAWGQGLFSNDATMSYPEDHEAVLEMYYRAVMAPWFDVTPSLQYIKNPGANPHARDALVMGMRANIIF